MTLRRIVGAHVEFAIVDIMSCWCGFSGGHDATFSAGAGELLHTSGTTTMPERRRMRVTTRAVNGRRAVSQSISHGIEAIQAINEFYGVTVDRGPEVVFFAAVVPSRPRQFRGGADWRIGMDSDVRKCRLTIRRPASGPRSGSRLCLA